LQDKSNNNTIHCECYLAPYLVLFRTADLDSEEVVQEPVYGLVLVKHEEELDNHRDLGRLEQLA